MPPTAIFPMNVLKKPIKSSTSDKSGLTVEPACPKALVNIPPIKDKITNSKAAIIPQIRIPINTFPTSCHPLRLPGSLKKSG